MKAPTHDSNPDDDFASFCGVLLVVAIVLIAIVAGGTIAAIAQYLR